MVLAEAAEIDFPVDVDIVLFVVPAPAVVPAPVAVDDLVPPLEAEDLGTPVELLLALFLRLRLQVQVVLAIVPHPEAANKIFMINIYIQKYYNVHRSRTFFMVFIF